VVRSLVRLARGNVLSVVAIVIALTGTAYAAAFDPIGRDGDIDACFNKRTGDLHILKGRKCRRGESRVTWGVTGPAGAQGPAGPAGAQGAQGSGGGTGPAGRSALQTLQSGEVVRGVIGQQWHATTATDEIYILGSLPVAAPVALTDAAVIVNGTYEDPGNVCTGSYAGPTAPSGRLCIYGAAGATVGENTEEEEGTSAGGQGGPATPHGFAVRIYNTAAGEASVHATWAYTAP
jgi:hypothetical protein